MHRSSDATTWLVGIVAVLVALSSATELGHRAGTGVALLVAFVITVTAIGRPRSILDRVALASTVGFSVGAAAWWPFSTWLIIQGYPAGAARDLDAVVWSGATAVVVAVAVAGLDVHLGRAPGRDGVADGVVGALREREPALARVGSPASSSPVPATDPPDPSDRHDQAGPDPAEPTAAPDPDSPELNPESTPQPSAIDDGPDLEATGATSEPDLTGPTDLTGPADREDDLAEREARAIESDDTVTMTLGHPSWLSRPDPGERPRHWSGETDERGDEEPSALPRRALIRQDADTSVAS